MSRLKYAIYIPLSFGLASLCALLFTGCSTPNDVVSIEYFKKIIEKKDNIVKQHIESLKSREQHQDKLLAEIENLKQLVEEQIRRGERTGAVITDGTKPNFQRSLPIIYGITPTYKRLTQKADLTRLSQTLLLVPNFHWIVVEDAESKTDLVERFLIQCKLKYTHLAVKTRPSLVQGKKDPRWLKARGVEQRNAGLKWLRDNVNKGTEGVVYLMDDDNTYDVEIFEQMRQTIKVSVWPVGLVGGLKWEGPVCENGKVVKFYTAWDFSRPFPIDMAAFAINLKLLFNNPTAEIDVNAARGHLESSLLKLLVTPDQLEPLADNCKKILVWHTQTAEPKMKQERKLLAIGKQSDPSLEV